LTLNIFTMDASSTPSFQQTMNAIQIRLEQLEERLIKDPSMTTGIQPVAIPLHLEKALDNFLQNKRSPTSSHLADVQVLDAIFNGLGQQPPLAPTMASAPGSAPRKTGGPVTIPSGPSAKLLRKTATMVNTPAAEKMAPVSAQGNGTANSTPVMTPPTSPEHSAEEKGKAKKSNTPSPSHQSVQPGVYTTRKVGKGGQVKIAHRLRNKPIITHQLLQPKVTLTDGSIRQIMLVETRNFTEGTVVLTAVEAAAPGGSGMQIAYTKSEEEARAVGAAAFTDKVWYHDMDPQLAMHIASRVLEFVEQHGGCPKPILVDSLATIVKQGIAETVVGRVFHGGESAFKAAEDMATKNEKPEQIRA
jgi:hypothetical protein